MECASSMRVEVHYEEIPEVVLYLMLNRLVGKF